MPAMQDRSDRVMKSQVKTPYLSRRLAKERTQCPCCGKSLQVGTLAWSHRCSIPKPVPEHVVQQRLDRMQANAVSNFKQRQQRLAMMGGAPLDCPTEPSALMNGNAIAEASQEGQGA